MVIYRLHKLLIKTLIFHSIRTGMANTRQIPHSALNEEDLGADIPPATSTAGCATDILSCASYPVQYLGLYLYTYCIRNTGTLPVLIKVYTATLVKNY